MLDTILSRCCDFYFNRINRNKLSEFLENKELNADLNLIINITNGSISQILKL